MIIIIERHRQVKIDLSPNDIINRGALSLLQISSLYLGIKSREIEELITYFIKFHLASINLNFCLVVCLYRSPQRVESLTPDT